MKKSFVILCLAALAACGTTEKQPRITSLVEDGSVTAVTYAPYTAHLSPEDPMTPAEACGDNGFSIPDDGPIYAVKVAYNNLPEQTRYLLLMPGDRVTLTGRLNIGTDDPNVIIGGSELYDTMYKELNGIEPQTKRVSYLLRRQELTPDERHELDSLTNWATQYIVDHIRNYPESPSTPYYLQAGMVPDSCYVELYNGIPEHIRNGKYKALYNEIRPENLLKGKVQE